MRRLTIREIEQIKYLRSRGLSVPEISTSLGIPKTTVLRYAQKVEILPEFKGIWAGKRGGSRNIKLRKEERALKEGNKLVKSISHRERLLFLCALYWAEGEKKDFSLSNTDPGLVRVFVDGLRDILGISNERIKISIRLYEDLDCEASLSFWSQVVRIPKNELHGINILPGKKRGKLKYGMCRVRVLKGGDLLKKLMGINKAVGGLSL